MFVLRNGKANQIFNVDGIGNIFIMGRRSVDEGTNFQVVLELRRMDFYQKMR
jgi:hypothetical protein